MRAALTLLVFFAATTVSAQEMELDLTDDGDAKPQVDAELRPAIAVLSVKSEDGEVSAARTRLIETEFIHQLEQGDDFKTVLDPAAVAERLGADASMLDSCDDYSCLERLAARLKVHRLAKITVRKHHIGSMVTLTGWDPGFNEVLVVSQDSGEKAEKTFLGVAGKTQAQKDREFVRKMNGFLRQIQKTLATPNGKIAIDTADPAAITLIDGVEMGLGSTEIIAQRGTRTVKVTSAGATPFVKTVKVEPTKVTSVPVALVAIPVAGPVVEKKTESSGGIGTRPGLYLAIVGAVAVGAGVVFGQAAQAVKTQLAAGGDPINVSRAEAKAAPTNALLANILVGAGSAAVVGGVTWLIVSAPPPPPAVKPSTGEPVETTPTGAMINIGGVF